jgi:glycosyltransferase involved in cell wall biosynthesis
MRIAIVHDWLTGMRGGEKVLDEICNLLPEADIYTLLHIKGSVSKNIESKKIFTSLLQKMPFAEKKYRYYLPFMPLFIKQFNFSEYDVVLSGSHCVAKGVSAGKDKLHICYCHTPMRYIWDKFDDYFSPFSSGFITRTVMSAVRPYLQKWDINTSKTVDYFIANSNNIKDKINRYYNRSAEVIYPPVDIDKYNIINDIKQEDFYLIVSAFAPYKKIDIAVKAFNHIGKPLKIIGTGQDEKILKKIAGNNIEFLGWRTDEEILQYYNKCRALIFPGEEDFGIVPIEVQACGKPVIAYAKGGVLETIINGTTGVFFYEQTVKSLIEAVEKLEIMNFDRRKIRESILRFGYKPFDANFLNLQVRHD